MTVCSEPQLQRPHVRVSAPRNISETLQAWFFKLLLMVVDSELYWNHIFQDSTSRKFRTKI